MTALTPPEIFLRLGMAFIAGVLLGTERETHGRPAGLRTTILASVAAAAAAVLAHQFAQNHGIQTTGTFRSDPGRIAAGVLTGIGFLGAGTIMRQGTDVRGVTTAAVLWLSTIIGLVFGSGEWMLGFCALLFAGITQGLLPGIENRLARNSYARITIAYDPQQLAEKELRALVARCGAKVQGVAFNSDFQNARYSVRYQVKWKTPRSIEVEAHLLAALHTDGVLAVRWE